MHALRSRVSLSKLCWCRCSSNAATNHSVTAANKAEDVSFVCIMRISTIICYLVLANSPRNERMCNQVLTYISGVEHAGCSTYRQGRRRGSQVYPSTTTLSEGAQASHAETYASRWISSKLLICSLAVCIQSFCLASADFNRYFFRTPVMRLVPALVCSTTTKWPTWSIRCRP